MAYATVAHLGNDSVTEPLPGAGKASGSGLKETTVVDLLRDLPTLSESDLASTVFSAESRVSSRILGGRITASNLKPLIHESTKTVVLPESFKEADNFIGAYLFKICRQLGYDVRLLPYNGARRTLEPYAEKVTLGIYMSLSDGSNSFRFTKKTDGYEIGRTISRAQQLIGALNSNRLDGSVLRENQLYFGNARPKKGTKPKEKVTETVYIVHTFPGLFQESAWDQELSRILALMLRRSWVNVDPEVLWKNLVPNIIPYSDVVLQACSKEIVIEPPRGKREAITKPKVPQKVRSNALVLKPELDFLNRISGPIWSPTPWEGLSQDQWAVQLWATGLDKIKTELSAQYNFRANFLSKLASVTTKRLKDLRVALGQDRLRKSDVKAQDLANLITSRENPVKDFTGEILSIDPQGTLFLREYYLGGYQDWSRAGGSADFLDYIRTQVPLDIVNDGFYEELVKSESTKLEKLRGLYDEVRAKESTQKLMLSELKKKYGSHFVDKWHLSIQDFDPLEYLKSKGAKVIDNDPKKGIIPPHDQQKPKVPKLKLGALVKNKDGSLEVKKMTHKLGLDEEDLWEYYNKVTPDESLKGRKVWDKLTLISQIQNIAVWLDEDDAEQIPPGLAFLHPVILMGEDEDRITFVNEFFGLNDVTL